MTEKELAREMAEEINDIAGVSKMAEVIEQALRKHRAEVLREVESEAFITAWYEQHKQDDPHHCEAYDDDNREFTSYGAYTFDLFASCPLIVACKKTAERLAAETEEGK